MSSPVPTDNRLFLAMDLPDAARSALAALAAERAAVVEGRAVPAENLHLTLQFLGRVGVERGSMLAGALASVAGMPAPRLRLLRVEARPSARRARLLAAVFEDVDRRLERVHARLTAAVAEALGAPVEEGPLWPHVTIARLRRPARAGAGVAPLDHTFGELAFDVSRASLYDSQSAHGGRRYVPLSTVELIASHGATSKTT